ncbi:amidase [Marinobacter sp. CP1]|jgi:amidase|uniref:amidase n=1 Tax=unclassified Marinobacter TaxID=83889 RepID=UPI00069FB83C|nr:MULTISPECIES: amidase [unclassified Marinobacter]AKV97552.1 amidase [Marinobacter sp. CP1]
MSAPQSCHSFRNDAIGCDDATALAERVLRREISITELTQAAIARAQAVEPLLHGLASANYDQAIRTASKLDAADQTGSFPLFRGVPTLIKDNTNVSGMTTRHGSLAVPSVPASDTSPFARQLLAQGFLCLGKSTLPEFGFNATTEPAHAPATCNPWNLAYSSGASSGGSAALVAAGVVPIAHANDGGGSIRIPAACCGLVGLKPTLGRLIDNEAAASLPINIISEGVVTRSVRDTANFFEQAETYFRNPGLPAIGRMEGPSGRPLRIGLVLDSINGHKTDDITRRTVEETALRLEKMGHRIEPVPVPVHSTFPDDFALYWALLAFGIRANGRKLLHPAFDKHKTDGLTNGLDRMFRRQFWRLPTALWRLKRSWHDYAHAMAGFDAVLTPVLGHTTPALGHLSPDVPFDTLFERLREYVSFTPLANATGAPAISLPMGHTPDQLPVSVQFMGRHGGERTLLDIAFTLEATHPWPLLCDFSRNNPGSGEQNARDSLANPA